MRRNRLLVWIVGLVALLHLGLFCLVADKKPLPKREYIAPPNFIVKEAPFTDAQSGEKLVYREFTVSTKLERPGGGPKPGEQAEER